MVRLIVLVPLMNEISVEENIQMNISVDIAARILINVLSRLKYVIVIKIVQKMMMKQLHVIGLIMDKNQYVIKKVFDAVIINFC